MDNKRSHLKAFNVWDLIIDTCYTSFKSRAVKNDAFTNIFNLIHFVTT